jgi:hypothetical protein
LAELQRTTGGVGPRELVLTRSAELPLEGCIEELALLACLYFCVPLLCPCAAGRTGGILRIATRQLLELRLDARCNLREQPLQFTVGKVAFLCIHRLAFTAIHGHQLARQQVQLLAPKRAGTADLPPRLEIVTPALRHRLVVGAEFFPQPQQFDRPKGLLLQTAARAAGGRESRQ